MSSFEMEHLSALAFSAPSYAIRGKVILGLTKCSLSFGHLIIYMNRLNSKVLSIGLFAVGTWAFGYWEGTLHFSDRTYKVYKHLAH